MRCEEPALHRLHRGMPRFQRQRHPLLVGGGLGLGLGYLLPSAKRRDSIQYGRFWHRTEINIARVSGYETASCFSEIVHRT